jgi:hypothetical protein
MDKEVSLVELPLETLTLDETSVEPRFQDKPPVLHLEVAKVKISRLDWDCLFWPKLAKAV